MKPVKTSNGLIFLVLGALLLLIPIGANFYEYYYTQNFDYIVEAACDPLTENCFLRDCSIPDNCPPNNLNYYKEYLINAYDFPKCRDNSCEFECENNLIDCEESECEFMDGIECTTPQI